jgi:heat-inducible transcriptional repressor
MTGVDDLDQRQREVLAAIIYEFIASGEPAGSRTLTRKYGLGVSAATIRNTMADLEEMGLLAQPHTSAGRLPTDLGLRLFVDGLMEVRHLDEQERRVIEARYGGLLLTNDGWGQVVRVLSEMTRQPAVVRSPRPSAQVLQHLRFVPLASGEVLALLVGATGVTQTRLLRVSADLAPARLERIHNYLNDLVPGRTLAEARRVLDHEVEAARERMDALALEAATLGRDALDEPAAAQQVVVHGQAHLVREGSTMDLDRIRQVMDLLEDQERLAELLDAMLASHGTIVLIGAEHPFTEVAGCSVIAAPYSLGGDAWGALAVIGPRSMNYAEMVPLVGFTARVISATEP